MIVSSSEVIAGTFTVFHVDGNIPKDAFFAVFGGRKYELMPVYGATGMALAIKGEHDLKGKKVTFLGKEGMT